MTSISEKYLKARQLIDDLHKRDPLYVKRKEQQAAQGAAIASAGVAVDGLDVTEELSTEKAAPSVDEREEEGQDEYAYANAMEEWIIALLEKTKGQSKVQDALSQIPGEEPIELIKLAARCQHLERFATPRSTFPEGKAGYLHWRRSLYTIQADKASSLLLEAGLSEREAKLVHTWVSKTDLKPGKEGGEWGTQVCIGKKSSFLLDFVLIQARFFFHFTDLGGCGCFSILARSIASFCSTTSWLYERKMGRHY